MRRRNTDRRKKIEKENKDTNKRNKEKADKKERWDEECKGNKKKVKKRLTSWK